MIMTKIDNDMFSDILRKIDEWKSYEELAIEYWVSYQWIAQKIHRNKKANIIIKPKEDEKLKLLKELKNNWCLNEKWLYFYLNYLWK